MAGRPALSSSEQLPAKWLRTSCIRFISQPAPLGAPQRLLKAALSWSGPTAWGPAENAAVAFIKGAVHDLILVFELSRARNDWQAGEAVEGMRALVPGLLTAEGFQEAEELVALVEVAAVDVFGLARRTGNEEGRTDAERS